MAPSQLNVEYWFRLFYDCIYSTCHGSVDASVLSAWLAHLWLWIVIIGYITAAIALVVIVYSIVRLFELREREEHYYSTLIAPPGSESGTHPRWEHIQSLVESGSVSDWSTAIIEADIMLDELLTKRGYKGAGVGEKLKTVDPAHFKTRNDAWEAHKVRNDIAHRGSALELSQSLVQRTIAHYEAVFREFKLI